MELHLSVFYVCSKGVTTFTKVLNFVCDRIRIVRGKVTKGDPGTGKVTLIYKSSPIISHLSQEFII